MIKEFYFLQFNFTYLFTLSLNVKQFDLTHRHARVDLGAIAMEYSTFPKALALPEPRH